MELLQKENKYKKMNTWESYYIQYFTYHNNIIEEQTCAKRNPLVYSIQNTAAHTRLTTPPVVG
jgi:hypothetical protein